MENNIFTAEKYLSDRDIRSTDLRTSEQLGSLMVAYAATVRPDVVVPSELDIVEYFKDTNFPVFYCGGANWMYDEIRRLNPGLKFTESK